MTCDRSEFLGAFWRLVWHEFWQDGIGPDSGGHARGAVWAMRRTLPDEAGDDGALGLRPLCGDGVRSVDLPGESAGDRGLPGFEASSAVSLRDTLKRPNLGLIDSASLAR